MKIGVEEERDERRGMNDIVVHAGEEQALESRDWKRVFLIIHIQSGHQHATVLQV